ncbi:MAG TPA: hypothetical protein VFD74_06555, partial [Thermoleophilia bacterium]|nr:hypothetical protein [Thermoleophilia bacterium]
SSNAKAEYHHGFLEISLPVADRCGSRRIPILNRDQEDECEAEAETPAADAPSVDAPSAGTPDDRTGGQE